MVRQGRVFTSSRVATTIFRVVGPATIGESALLRQAAEERLDQGAAGLRVDLSECAWMDSTFLGMLLVLARRAERSRQGARLSIASPSAECRRVLDDTGVADLLEIASTAEPQGPWTELLGPIDDVEALRRNVLSAHQQLAQLPGDAGAEFREVARALSDDARR